MKTISRCLTVKETIYLEEKQKTTYGISLEWEDGTVFEKHDIDPNESTVQTLAEKLLHETTDEEQL